MTIALPKTHQSMSDADKQTMRRIARLTDRRRQVAILTAQGYTIRDIALRLGITPQTVKNHLTHVYRAVHTDTSHSYHPAVRLAYLVGRYMRDVDAGPFEQANAREVA